MESDPCITWCAVVSFLFMWIKCFGSPRSSLLVELCDVKVMLNL